jgi:uncharacterized membrane protein YgcG
VGRLQRNREWQSHQEQLHSKVEAAAAAEVMEAAVAVLVAEAAEERTTRESTVAVESVMVEVGPVAVAAAEVTEREVEVGTSEEVGETATEVMAMGRPTVTGISERMTTGRIRGGSSGGRGASFWAPAYYSGGWNRGWRGVRGRY